MITNCVYDLKKSVEESHCQESCDLQSYEFMVEAVTEPAIFMSPTGDAIAMNTLAAKRLGATPKDLVGKNLFELLPSDVAKNQKEHVGKAFRTSAVQVFEDQLNGTCFRNTIVPIFTRENKKRAIAFFAVDISKEKQLEQKDVYSCNRLEAILGNVPDAVVVTDLNGNPKYVNQSAERMFTVTAAELIRNGNIFRLLPGLKKHEPALREVKELNNLLCVVDNKKTVTLSVCVKHINALQDELLFVCSDVTALKEAEEQLFRKTIALGEVVENNTKDKVYVSKTIGQNARKLVFPIVDMMAEKPDCAPLARLLKSTIEHITSSFSKEQSAENYNLSPREMQICNMIHSGMTVKQIAGILNTSPYTVETQRKVIRKKLGISDGKTNLSSFLEKMLD